MKMCYNSIGDSMKEDVVDLFAEEVNKRELSEERKMAKRALKEKKREKKREKKLERKEDIEFAKKLEEKKQEQTKEMDTEALKKIRTRREKNEFISEETKERHPFLNFLLAISIIILLVCSVTYVLFNVIKEKDLETILTSSALCGMVVFYILSIIIKNIRAKKFFEILATLSIAGYMAYFLFIA